MHARGSKALLHEVKLARESAVWRHPTPERKGPPFVGTYQGETEEADHLLRVAVVRHLHRKKNGPPFGKGRESRRKKVRSLLRVTVVRHLHRKRMGPPFGKGRDKRAKFPVYLNLSYG